MTFKKVMGLVVPVWMWMMREPWADTLQIPFYVINCEAKFKKTVVDDFVETYIKGRTSNSLRELQCPLEV